MDQFSAGQGGSQTLRAMEITQEFRQSLQHVEQLELEIRKSGESIECEHPAFDTLQEARQRHKELTVQVDRYSTILWNQHASTPPSESRALPASEPHFTPSPHRDQNFSASSIASWLEFGRSKVEKRTNGSSLEAAKAPLHCPKLCRESDRIELPGCVILYHNGVPPEDVCCTLT